jgi:hypothetical protein
MRLSSLRLRAAAAIVFPAAVIGCAAPTRPEPAPDSGQVPDLLKGAIGEFTEIRGDSHLTVRGLGLVVGLGTNGHTTVHPAVRERVKSMILRHLREGGAEGKTPVVRNLDALIDDPDTAVVEVVGRIPPGCPQGGRFDIDVIAWPGTDTKSLAGGILFTADLHLLVDFGGAPTQGAVKARASGVLFQPPTTEEKDARKAAGASVRTARVIGGGRALHNRPILLTLRDSDPRRAYLVRDRVNEHFQQGAGPLARARSDYNVEIVQVPARYRDDLEHFLRLIPYLPRDTSAVALEKRADFLGRRLAAGGAREDLDGLSLALQGVGKPALARILPVVRDEKQPVAVRLAGAEAGARLGDSECAVVLGEFAFGRGLGPEVSNADRLEIQERAVRGLVGSTGASRSGAALNGVLMRHPNPTLRILAYEGLRRRGDKSIRTVPVIQRFDDDRHRARIWFDLDLVPKDVEAPFLIYATHRDTPRIAVFGSNLETNRSMTYVSRTEVEGGGPRLVIAPGGEDAEKVSVEVWTRTGKKAPVRRCRPMVAEIIELLGKQAPDTDRDPDFGFGMSYSEVVGVVYELIRGDAVSGPKVPAVFVLQPKEPEPSARSGTLLDEEMSPGPEPATERRPDRRPRAESDRVPAGERSPTREGSPVRRAGGG